MTDRPTGRCPICGEKNRNRHDFILWCVDYEKANPARSLYGAVGSWPVDRPRVDAHLRAEGVIA